MNAKTFPNDPTDHQDTRCPFTLKAVMSWPRYQSVFSPRVRMMIAALNGGSALPHKDRLKLSVNSKRD